MLPQNIGEVTASRKSKSREAVVTNLQVPSTKYNNYYGWHYCNFKCYGRANLSEESTYQSLRIYPIYGRSDPSDLACLLKVAYHVKHLESSSTSHCCFPSFPRTHPGWSHSAVVRLFPALGMHVQKGGGAILDQWGDRNTWIKNFPSCPPGEEP